ncbi:hypothetical protein [Candidatus Symbiopectobacterium endolongispinus]|uniref:hypothetical protein n=1 Tax=Candidatus Symbiopectobacterium endolongispinus TaxID=2812664 RepID=UPI0020793150|nr:hypothetical protein [Candidatus Symbiopectobacterium endolongispinus]MBT9428944.1 hypothetical protein [Candidatus Symbiopectobacterium endolongispinus]
MPLFRKSGGTFAPVNSLKMKHDDTFKNVQAMWVNDGGVFKKVYPGGPIDAGTSGVIDVVWVIGSMSRVGANTPQGYTPLYYSNGYSGAQGGFYAFLLLSDQAQHTVSVTSSVARFFYANRNIIQTSTSGVQSGSVWTPTTPVDEQINILGVGRVDNVYGIANKSFADAPKLPASYAGTEIHV